MKVRAAAFACVPDLANRGSGRDFITNFGIQAFEMTVLCLVAVRVRDFDRQAISALVPGKCHCASAGSLDGMLLASNGAAPPGGDGRR